MQPIVQEVTKSNVLYYVIGILFVIANIGGFWLREWLKHRTWSKNGKDLLAIKEGQDDIKKDVSAVAGKVGRVKTAITRIETQQKLQTESCKSTVERFDKAIGDHSGQILDLAKEKK